MTQIWIAGLGIQTVCQVTREAENAIRSSREVLYLDTGVATARYLESLCPRATPLYEESYAEGRPRTGAYEHMAARVVEAALDHPPVTFAIHGHPLVAVHAPFLVMAMAEALGLRVEVVPGISALDCLLADLRIDPVIHGMQMYEATDLLLRRRPLQPDVPLILWQIGPLETCLHTMRVSKPERFTRLVAYLSRFYPARHEVVAVYSSPHPLMPASILRFAIEDMGQLAEQFHAGFTLYVPPSSGRPVQDLDLVQKLYSAQHLCDMTR
jgi:siroheme synthase